MRGVGGMEEFLGPLSLPQQHPKEVLGPGVSSTVCLWVPETLALALQLPTI